MKKILLIALCLCMLMLTSSFAFASTDTEGVVTENTFAEVANNFVAEKMQANNSVVKVITGEATFNKEKFAKSLMGIQPNESFPIIKTEVGTSYFDVDKYLASIAAQKSSNSALLRATKPPTSEAPYYPYDANWSGTVNCSYTSYYFRAGTFLVEATGFFSVDWYRSNGLYQGTTNAVINKNTGKNTVNAFLETQYYAVLTNASGSPAQNATYIAN